MPKVKQKFSDIGNKFARPDLERIGLFSEMPWLHGKGYKFSKPEYVKGLNMLAEGTKIKTGKQDCYFDKEFKRIFKGEAIKGRGKKQKPSPFKNITSSPFMPPGGNKKHSTVGDYYGCFSGNIEAFSPKTKPGKPHKPENLNFITNPGKKGNAGYPNICINPYPPHSDERYGLVPKHKEYGKVLDGPMVTAHYPSPYFEKNPFVDPSPGPTYVKPKQKVVPSRGIFVPTGPAKWQGGCHGGCFDKLPEHKSDRQTKSGKPPKAFLSGPWFPQSFGDKTYYTMSVMNENTRFRLNTTNQDSYQPTFVKYLIRSQ